MRTLLLCCLFYCLLVPSSRNAYAGEPACADTSFSAVAPAGDLTLFAALQAALRHHPDLRIAGCEIDASAGRALQAGLRPNPVASLAVENFAGSDTRAGFESAETTLQVSQLIELGHKRARRAALADAERALAIWALEGQRLAIITATRNAYIEVLAAQARLRLATELAALSESVHATVAAKVTAGKVSPVEESRALIDVQRTTVGVSTAQNALRAARQQLALNWGGATMEVGEALGDLGRLPARPTYAQIVSRLEHNPALARWPDELARRQRALELAAANGVRDLTLSGGVRQFQDSDDLGIVFGVSVPLPLFDRNQGAVLAAQADMAAADAGQESARRSLLAQVFEQYQALESAAAEEATLREQTLPLAGRIFAATSEGYRHGKFGLIDVLDAQRTLFESRATHVDALARYQRAAAALEGLTGVDLAGAESVETFQLHPASPAIASSPEQP